MAVLWTSSKGWIISHSLFFERMKVISEPDPSSVDQEPRDLKLDPNLFEIVNPFIVAKSVTGPLGLHSTPGSAWSDTTSKIAKLYQSLVRRGREEAIFRTTPWTKTREENNRIARHCANTFYEKVHTLNFDQFFGKNSLNLGILSTVSNHSFVFPPHTSFYCYNIDDLAAKLEGQTFDLIVMDPPWRNKYVRRRKRKQEEAAYQLLDTVDIGKIPIQNISQDNSLIVVWCTNAEDHQAQIINKFFPQWGVMYLTTWYWVKVTTNGDPIVPFNCPNKKQPYEAIIIGHRASTTPQRTELEDLKVTKLVLSVPSSLHSHKPPLIDILKKYLKTSEGGSSGHKHLELFARYLVPGFTSFGNEVIKLQHASLYVDVTPRVEKVS